MKKWLICSLLCLVVTLFAFSFIRYHFIDVNYETTSVLDYGTYIGNYDNETPTTFSVMFLTEN